MNTTEMYKLQASLVVLPDMVEDNQSWLLSNVMASGADFQQVQVDVLPASVQGEAPMVELVVSGWVTVHGYLAFVHTMQNHADMPPQSFYSDVKFNIYLMHPKQELLIPEKKKGKKGKNKKGKSKKS